MIIHCSRSLLHIAFTSSHSIDFQDCISPQGIEIIEGVDTLVSEGNNTAHTTWNAMRNMTTSEKCFTLPAMVCVT